MVMSKIWCGIVIVSLFASVLTGQSAALAAAIPAGAQAGATLAMTLMGSLVLWTGVGKLMEAGGVTGALSRMLSPLLGRLFPSTRQDGELSEALSGNICANVLGWATLPPPWASGQ